MKTIIAEKPSVAREIARIVGATKREEGYFEGGGYAVTWAFGHLVQLAMPDGYGVRGFVRDNLPIIPDTFTLVPPLCCTPQLVHEYTIEKYWHAFCIH